MINFLAKLFIKNYKDYKSPSVRSAYGVLCGYFGIFWNVILFLLKLVAGLMVHSLSMVADAINNLSDAASSVVSIIGFKLSNKKPDSTHPFGHGRVEYICGLVISFLILMMSVELFKSSIESLINPKPVEASLFALIVLIASILIKFYMFLYNNNIAKKINSVAMSATAKDSFDGIAGIIVALSIFFAGIEAAKETISPLLGKSPEKEFVEEIQQELLKFEPIVGMHDLLVHDYGPGRFMISLHAEVPGHLNIFELHDVIDNAEVALAKKFNSSVVIHMDPIDTNNEQIKEYKDFVVNILHPLHKDFSVHDFRIVPGLTHTNIIFDIVRPYECKLTDKDLISYVQTKVKESYPNLNCVIIIDNPYI